MADIDGTSGGETLVGTSGDDLIRGLGGNDVIDGVGGLDRLEGGTGDDVYFADNDDLVIEAAGEGYDTVYARASFTLGAGQEVEVLDSFDRSATLALSLTGNAFAQGLVGNAGNNILDGAGGTDVFYGLGGDDTYVVDSADDLVVEYSGDGSDRVRASASYALAAGSHVEVLEAFDQAGTGALNLTGNELAQILTGNAGANLLYGAGGGDTYFGLGGDDVYFVGSGDVVNEAAGQGYDTVYAMASFTLGAGQEVEVLDSFDRAGTAALVLTGNGFSQGLVGNAGNNVLDGGGGVDLFYGLGGNDTYIVDSADDLAVEYAGQGSDTVITSVSYALHPDSQVENLQVFDQNGTAAINLTGNAFVQTISGNAGANVLNGGGGSDTMIGFGGDDLYIIDNSGDLVLEDVGGGNDTIRASVSYTLAAASQVETLEVSDPNYQFGVNLTGNALAQTFTGNAGRNILNGGGGTDTFYGLGGNDIYYVDSADDVVIEQVGDSHRLAGQPGDEIITTVSYELLAGSEIEVLKLADAATTNPVNLTGNEFGQEITGNAGNNILDGRGGADIMTGLGGDDTYYVDNAGDQVVETSITGGFDVIIASVSYTISPNSPRSYFEVLKTADSASTQPLDLDGAGRVQTVIGNAGSNYLRGAEEYYGLTGDDFYFVFPGDQVFEQVGDGYDVVLTDSSFTLDPGSEVERIVRLYTYSSNDNRSATLVGNEFSQEIRGVDTTGQYIGDDRLDGKGGSDTLEGLRGNDVFLFSTALGPDNVDHIVDLTDNQFYNDSIGLHNQIFTALGAAGALNADAFFAGTAAHDADDRIIYDQATGNLYYDADGSGVGAQILFAILDNKATLTAADFTVIDFPAI